ncbi:hypothetical protein PspLS_11344 [Pyricularia sp. CBS 133598]|nr:hypothetical protein PspLS_11344 [Pyricularia sp. CBS 133598]
MLSPRKRLMRTPSKPTAIKRSKRNILILGHFNISLDKNWYASWIKQRLKDLPPSLLEIEVSGVPLGRPGSYKRLAQAIDQFALRMEGTSVNDIIEHLYETNVLRKDQHVSSTSYRVLVFACLGWQSMLFLPAFNVCSFAELAIYYDDNQPNSGLVFDTFRVPSHLSDRPLSILLKAFGHILPAGPTRALSLPTETLKSVASWKALWPEEINVYLLQVLLRVRLRWVDCLALHLDYDKSTQTLCLFAYPSICASMLDSHGTIFAFASIETNAADPRADRGEIDCFLREVLLSYRLLFGQCPKSRRLFRSIGPSAQIFQYGPDTLLQQLCTNKQLSQAGIGWVPDDRAVYYASKDFSILRDRVELISNELEKVRPRSMGDLVHDKRDAVQYWTFWSISIIGGINIVLSLTQIILQCLQLAQDNS